MPLIRSTPACAPDSGPSFDATIRRDIEQRIRVIGGHAVLMAGELAEICGVSVARLEKFRLQGEPLPGELCFQIDLGEGLAAWDQDTAGAPSRNAFTESGALLVVMALEKVRPVALAGEVARAFARHRQARKRASASRG